jgi:hypothetical protein
MHARSLLCSRCWFFLISKGVSLYLSFVVQDHGKPLDACCVQCDIAVCISCLPSHKGHDFLPTELVVAQLKAGAQVCLILLISGWFYLSSTAQCMKGRVMLSIGS